MHTLSFIVIVNDFDTHTHTLYILSFNYKTIILFKRMIQNIFDGRTKFCFNISEHFDSVISEFLNSCDTMHSFIFAGLSSIILSPVIPIVLVYSELPVVTRRISLSLRSGSKLLRGLIVFDGFIKSRAAIIHGSRYARFWIVSSMIQSCGKVASTRARFCLEVLMDPRFVRSRAMIDFLVVYSDTAYTVRSRCSKVIDTWVTVCIRLTFHLSLPDNLSCRPSQNLASPRQFLRSFPTS